MACIFIYYTSSELKNFRHGSLVIYRCVYTFSCFGPKCATHRLIRQYHSSGAYQSAFFFLLSFFNVVHSSAADFFEFRGASQDFYESCSFYWIEIFESIRWCQPDLLYTGYTFCCVNATMPKIWVMILLFSCIVLRFFLCFRSESLQFLVVGRGRIPYTYVYDSCSCSYMIHGSWLVFFFQAMHGSMNDYNVMLSGFSGFSVYEYIF